MSSAMAHPPPPPAAQGPPQAPAPAADLTGVCFRNQWFLDAVRGFLSVASVFDYFAGSPFYDPNCSNERLRMRGVHPLDPAHLKTMEGWEYALHEAKEPFLFVLKKQRRDSPEKTTVSTMYYVLDGSIYQAPTAHAIITSRLSRSVHHLHEAFGGLRSLLKPKPTKKAGKSRQGAQASQAGASGDPVQQSRMDVIIHSALSRLPPAPEVKLLQPPPPPPPTTTATPAEQGETSEKPEQRGPSQAPPSAEKAPEGAAPKSGGGQESASQGGQGQEQLAQQGGPLKRQKR